MFKPRADLKVLISWREIKKSAGGNQFSRAKLSRYDSTRSQDPRGKCRNELRKENKSH